MKGEEAVRGHAPPWILAEDGHGQLGIVAWGFVWARWVLGGLFVLASHLLVILPLAEGLPFC